MTEIRPYCTRANIRKNITLEEALDCIVYLHNLLHESSNKALQLQIQNTKLRKRCGLPPINR